MVYYGISRGCETCKKRRKKCDGRKPSCNVCRKTGRQCLGYKDYSSLIFRHFTPATSNWPIAHQQNAHSVDKIVEWNALKSFIRNFIVEPADEKNSRGFLHGLQAIIRGLPPSSDLVRAASAVSMACKGNCDRDSAALTRAAEEYGVVLQSFRGVLSRNTTAWSVQTLVTAILLGLYEIVDSYHAPSSNQNVHAQGVCALIAETRATLHVSADVKLFKLAQSHSTMPSSNESRLPGVLCAPITCCIVLSLDDILIECRTLFARATTALSDTNTTHDDIKSLQQDAQKVEQKCSQWGVTRFSGWRPHAIGFITAQAPGIMTREYCVPGPVLTYSDLYVAAVWNSYRKAHILVLDIMNQCSERLGDVCTSTTIQHRAASIAASLTSSIPFHLAHNLEQYVNASETGSEVSTGPSVGGLLLIHPLYIAANCTVIPLETRLFFGRCLAWIGRHMGIGLASQMSGANTQDSELYRIQSTITWQDEPGISFYHRVDAESLLWAAMLLRPTQDYNTT